MRLTEVTVVGDAALPVAVLAAHLRLGSGFGLPAGEEPLLASHLRAALAAIEGRTGKALLTRRFKMALACWREDDVQTLPLAPVGQVVSMLLRDAAGDEVLLPAARWRLEPDSQRPRLRSIGGGWPMIAQGGQAEILFDAGFGQVWSDLPADLAQAVLLLAAEFYEHRHGDMPGQGLPRRVAELIEGWRQVRLFGGRR